MNLSYPGVITKKDALITENLRSHSLFHWVKVYPKTNLEVLCEKIFFIRNLQILIMGPGVKKKEDVDYIPEILEISAALWENTVQFTILDHNERVRIYILFPSFINEAALTLKVIDAVGNKFYFTDSTTVYGLPLTDSEKQEYLQYVLNVSEEVSPNKRKFHDNERHTFKCV